MIFAECMQDVRHSNINLAGYNLITSSQCSSNYVS